MKAITTTYHGPTDTKGSRIIATDHDGHRLVVSYDYGARNPHAVAARKFAERMAWTGTLIGGWQKPGVEVFVFCPVRLADDGDSVITIPRHEECDGFTDLAEGN